MRKENDKIDCTCRSSQHTMGPREAEPTLFVLTGSESEWKSRLTSIGVSLTQVEILIVVGMGHLWPALSGNG